MSRKPFVAAALVASTFAVGVIVAPPALSDIGPNAGDIAASSPAYPGGPLTLTVTTGFSCDANTTFDPPDSTATVLSQDASTVIVADTPLVATATGGTVTVTLPADLPLGTYTMQFLCNNDQVSSTFGSNEFEVTAAPPTTTTAPPTTTAAPAVAAATTPSFTG